MTHKSKKGFTLAEVLVTLAIVGVLASMTIPTLLQNLNDAQYKTAWKKQYADIAQATYKMVGDNGGSLSGLFTDDNVMKNSYSTYLNSIKSCTNSVAENCWYSATPKFLKGTNATAWLPAGLPGLVLSNGSLLAFYKMSSTCDTSINGAFTACGYVEVDINGNKSPNTIGKDIFMTYITANATKPVGTQGDWDNPSASCVEGSTGSSNYGTGCSAKYLYN